MGTWGDQTGELLDILSGGNIVPLSIRHHSLFQAGFARWHALRSHGQHDYGDFLSCVLGRLGTTLVAQMTQRRLSTEAGVVVAEKSDMRQSNCARNCGKDWLTRYHFRQLLMNGRR